MSSLNISDVCKLLRENGFDEEVIETMRTNKIDGSTFIDLNSQDLKELGIVALGDRKRLEKLRQGSSVSNRQEEPKVLKLSEHITDID